MSSCRFLSRYGCDLVQTCSIRAACLLFFFKQKTAYEMRISDWSSDVCSSDLHYRHAVLCQLLGRRRADAAAGAGDDGGLALQFFHCGLPFNLSTNADIAARDRTVCTPLSLSLPG